MPNTEPKQMIDRAKYDYKATRVADPKTGKVRNRVSNGDAVARAMLGITFEQLPKTAKANGLEELVSKHKDSVNPGQFRMIIGNALRAKVKRGEEVTIGDVLVKKLDQREPVVKDAPKVERAAPAPKAKKTKSTA